MAGSAASPALAAGPSHLLHATWVQDAGAGDQNIYYSASSDDGLTWSAPVSVASSLGGIAADVPDIQVEPSSGRVFIAHTQRHVSTGARSVWLAFSDNGINWQVVEVHASPVNPGPPKVITDRGPNYHVYVVYEHVVGSDESNLFVRRADGTDLTTWSTLECLGCNADANVYSDPDIAFQVGEDADPRVFVSYVTGADDPHAVEVYWYDDRTATEGVSRIRDESPTLTTSPTIAASRNGDTVLVAWIRHDVGDAIVRWAYQTNPILMPPWTMGTPEINTPGLNDFEPGLAADGEGTSDDGVGGNYHLTYHHPTGFASNLMEYRTLPTALPASWTPTGHPGDGSHHGSGSGLTVQLRNGSWYPSILYHDLLNAPSPLGRSDIYFVTPGGLRVETTPTGRVVRCCESSMTDYLAPHTFTDWVAGTDRILEVPAQQPGADGVRYVYESWSDGGMRRHAVAVAAMPPYAEASISVTLGTQYKVVVQTEPPGLTILVDDAPVSTPTEFWWDAGTTHTIVAREVAGGREFGGWADDAPRVRSITANGPVTVTARYALPPFPVAVVALVAVAAAGLLAFFMLRRRRKVPRTATPPPEPTPKRRELPEEWEEEPESAGPPTQEFDPEGLGATQAVEEPEEHTMEIEGSKVDGIASRLAQLEQLSSEGLLTESEYLEKRRALLERL